jgi:hypothetical protein
MYEILTAVLLKSRVFWNVKPSEDFLNPKMAALCPFEMSVTIHQPTWCNIPDDVNLQGHQALELVLQNLSGNYELHFPDSLTYWTKHASEGIV